MSRNILKSLQDNGSIINNEQSYLPNHPGKVGLPPEQRKLLRGQGDILAKRFLVVG